MKYDATDYFRFINKLGQLAMSAPYGAEIPRTALVEMLRVLTTHYDRPAAPVFVPIGRFIQRDGEWIAAASNSPTGETLYRAPPSAQPSGAPEVQKVFYTYEYKCPNGGGWKTATTQRISDYNPEQWGHRNLRRWVTHEAAPTPSGAPAVQDATPTKGQQQ